MTDTVALNGIVVGPDQWLVLTAPTMTVGQARELRERMPEALRGRVLVVCGGTDMQMAAVTPAVTS
jgi:hypothetical protein